MYSIVDVVLVVIVRFVLIKKKLVYLVKETVNAKLIVLGNQIVTYRMKGIKTAT